MDSMAEQELAKMVLDAIIEYNKARRSGASLFQIEYKCPQIDADEISQVLEGLIEEGKVVKQNYLYYPKEN